MSKLESMVNSVRTGVGFWIRNEFTFVRIIGSDAASWLHSQTTNDIEGLATGTGNHNAILDRQGRLQGHFTVHRWEDEFWILIEQSQVDAVLKHLDDHLFIEDVQVEHTEDSLEQLVLQGPKSMAFLASCMDDESGMSSSLLPEEWYGVHPVELFGQEVLAFRLSISGEDGYVFVGEQGECATLNAEFSKRGNDIVDSPVAIESDAQEVLRVEAGIPRFGVDMDASYRIPETTLERTAVSYEKGCYLGQEVVARLKAYGSVKQALTGLVFENDIADWNVGCTLQVDGKTIGRGMSKVFSPTLDRWIALAYLNRDHRAPGTVLDIEVEDNSGAVCAEVRVLPFYESGSREQVADGMYHTALELFQVDVDDTDATAIPMLQEAILLHPGFEDAYEVLGVILNRHHRVDEAIYYMNRLKELNPNCIMAHTNLSVFYLAKGMIEEAEVAKAQSAVLQIQHATDERKATEMAAQERSRIEDEAKERIGMFLEVLEIDPDDPVATFGLGKAYVQLSQYEDAIPHLFHATEVQKDFSAAYLDLGKCYEFLERTDEARSTFETGIGIASRKGDLMPMREMERRLKAF